MALLLRTANQIAQQLKGQRDKERSPRKTCGGEGTQRRMNLTQGQTTAKWAMGGVNCKLIWLQPETHHLLDFF